MSNLASLMPEIWLQILQYLDVLQLRSLLLVSKSFKQLARQAIRPKRFRANLLNLKKKDQVYTDNMHGKLTHLDMGCMGGCGIYYAIVKRPDCSTRYHLARWNFAKQRFENLQFSCLKWRQNALCSAGEHLLLIDGGHLVRVDALGRTSQKLFPLSPESLVSMTVDHEGNLVVATKRGLSVYSMQGQLLRTLTVVRNPAHVAISPEGLYVVSDTRARRLVACRLDGTIQHEFMTAEKLDNSAFAPAHFDIDGLGRILLISLVHWRLFVFSPELHFLGALSHNFVGHPSSVHFSDTGRIYFNGVVFGIV